MSDDLVSVDRAARSRVEQGAHGGRGIYWVLKNVLLGPAVSKVFRPIEEGTDNVPEEGAAILASNHLSFADWLFMPLALDRRVTFVAKSDYFTGAGIKGWAQKRFFAGTGQVPIDRTGGRASEGALRAGLKVLQRGELFGIYPEGTRSHDGRLYKGRTGVARLALLAGVPVIPSAVIGTDVIAPPGKIVTKIVSPTVKFGEPLDFSRYAGDERGPLHPALDHRRDHVRDHGALRPGVRRPLRALGQGGRGARGQGRRRPTKSRRRPEDLVPRPGTLAATEPAARRWTRPTSVLFAAVDDRVRVSVVRCSGWAEYADSGPGGRSCSRWCWAGRVLALLPARARTSRNFSVLVTGVLGGDHDRPRPGRLLHLPLDRASRARSGRR